MGSPVTAVIGLFSDRHGVIGASVIDLRVLSYRLRYRVRKRTKCYFCV